MNQFISIDFTSGFGLCFLHYLDKSDRNDGMQRVHGKQQSPEHQYQVFQTGIPSHFFKG